MTEQKNRKPRARKQQTAQALMESILPQSLTIKVELLKLLKQAIDDDGKALKEQLALISNA